MHFLTKIKISVYMAMLVIKSVYIRTLLSSVAYLPTCIFRIFMWGNQIDKNLDLIGCVNEKGKDITTISRLYFKYDSIPTVKSFQNLLLYAGIETNKTYMLLSRSGKFPQIYMFTMDLTKGICLETDHVFSHGIISFDCDDSDISDDDDFLNDLVEEDISDMEEENIPDMEDYTSTEESRAMSEESSL